VDTCDINSVYSNGIIYRHKHLNMGSFQETLNSLQPYVIQIRYVSNVPVIDAVFKNGWILPESKVIKKVKGGETESNYYMIYSEQEGIGLDEVLDYIKVVINVNLEREEKHALLKDKIEELKTFFKQNSLSDLKRMKFVLGNEDTLVQADEIGLHEIDPVVEEPVVETQPQTTSNQHPLGWTPEEIEMNEEEQRAEKNRILDKQRKERQTVRQHQRVELPPKQQQREMEYVGGECNCGPEEACSKCIDTKGY
jgi:hypothetical protein